MTTRIIVPNEDKTGGFGKPEKKFKHVAFYQYMEHVFTITPADSITIDITNGSVQLLTCDRDVTIAGFTGWPPSGTCANLTLMVNPGTYTVTWPTEILWENSVVPTLKENAANWISLWSVDGGTTIYATASLNYGTP